MSTFPHHEAFFQSICNDCTVLYDCSNLPLLNIRLFLTHGFSFNRAAQEEFISLGSHGVETP